jgi:Flp pilus assembly protein, pilin Flp
MDALRNVAIGLFVKASTGGHALKKAAIRFVREESWTDEEWNERGAGVIEYSLIAGIMAAIIITGLATVTGGISNVFSVITTALNGVAG